MIEKVFAPLKDALAKKVVLSVAWTWDSAKWEQVLPGVAHISTVPNTPVSVGEGVIACEKASTLSDEQSAVVLDLLGKLCAVVELGQHPASMKDAVCSPGGATIKGVVALEDAGMRSALVKAIDATLQ